MSIAKNGLWIVKLHPKKHRKKGSFFKCTFAEIANTFFSFNQPANVFFYVDSKSKICFRRSHVVFQL